MNIRGYIASLLVAAVIVHVLLGAAAAGYPDEAQCRSMPQIAFWDAATSEQVKLDLIDFAVKVSSSADVLLIGERHGAFEHVSATICLLRELKQHNISVVFEQLSEHQTPIIASHRAEFPESPRGLATKLDWASSGWPSWGVYAPLFEFLWTSRHRIVAGDFVVKSSGSMPKIDSELNPRSLKVALGGWQNSMMIAHCKLISDARAKDLAKLQVLRDQNMARRIEFERDRGRFVILYAGRSHIRKDRSVPLHLPDSFKIVSLALMDSSLGDVHLSSGQFDFQWAVGEVASVDPCERFTTSKQ